MDKTQTGTTDVVRKALLAKEIDIYPEYTGSGLLFFEGRPGVTPETFKDPERATRRSRRWTQANGVVWLSRPRRTTRGRSR